MKALRLTLKITQIVLLVVAFFVFVSGLGVASRAGTERHFEDASENFEITITDKAKGNSNSECVFKYVIKNNSELKAYKVTGYMTVSDYNGNQISAGSTSFTGEFFSDSENKFTLTYQMNDAETANKVINTDLQALNIYFRITEISFEDGDYTAPETAENKLIKPCDETYLSNAYNTALTKFQAQDYESAIELFLKLDAYKDSANKVIEVQNAQTAQKNDQINQKYAQAIAAYNNSQFVESAIIFNSILEEAPEHSYASASMNTLKQNAENISKFYIQKGEYQNALDFLTKLGYSKDSYDTPDNVYNILSACENAIKGMYSGVVNLGFSNFVIPYGTTEIKKSAFENCAGLKSITIPETVTSIGETAFFYCTSLENIVIPASVKTLGLGAFYGCSSLTSITIPESITAIPQETFSKCTNLTTVKLPNTLSSIGAYAFYNCKNLKNLTIPDSVTIIGEKALDGCISITEVTIPAINGLEFNSLFSSAYPGFPSTLKKVTISSGTILGNSFFKDSKLEEVILPEGLTTIEKDAFYNCMITKLSIPASVTTIGEYAFQYSNIGSFTVPTTMTKIPANIFHNSSLTTVYIHSGVTHIGSNAFGSRKVTVTYGGTKLQWENLCNASSPEWNINLDYYTVICTDATYTRSPATSYWE